MRRKVLTIAVAALMVVAIAGAAGAVASETNWRIRLLADNGAGGGAAPAMQIGVYPNRSDGLDTVGPQDSVAAFGADLTGTARWAVGVLADDSTNVYNHDIKSTASPYTYPNGAKIWDLRVMAGMNADSLPIRLLFKSLVANPLATVGGLPIFFQLKMVNNRGVVGAPANGTLWDVPIDSGTSGSVFWSIDTAQDTTGHVWGNLPLLKSASTLDAGIMRAQGYEMQFVQTAVPEPSGVLALGGSLVVLAGFIRRRK